MRFFATLLLLLVGVVFATAPAGLLTKLCAGHFDGVLNFWVWITIIFAYYFLATIIPIDKIIGRYLPYLWCFTDYHGCWCNLRFILQHA